MTIGLILAALLFCPLLRAEWFPVVIEAPTYPALATQARIAGVVRLKLKLDDSGRVKGYDAASGPALLVRAAQENIRLWKFASIGSAEESRVIDFQYEYRLEGSVQAKPATRFRYEHPFRAIVISQSVQWTPIGSLILNSVVAFYHQSDQPDRASGP
jgi:TonB family protein